MEQNQRLLTSWWMQKSWTRAVKQTIASKFKMVRVEKFILDLISVSSVSDLLNIFLLFRLKTTFKKPRGLMPHIYPFGVHSS